MLVARRRKDGGGHEWQADEGKDRERGSEEGRRGEKGGGTMMGEPTAMSLAPSVTRILASTASSCVRRERQSRWEKRDMRN